VEALLRLAAQNLSAAQKDSIEVGVRTAVAGYIGGLSMGAPVMFNKLLGLVVQPDAIADAALLIGVEAGGQFYSFKGNLSTEDRKAKIDPQRIFIGLMDETVFIDIAVLVEANPAQKAAGPAQVTPAIQAAVTNAVNLVLRGAHGAIARQDLIDSIRSVLAAQAPQLQLAAANPVSPNAEFAESGRLINNADTIALADNESPSLRSLSVNLKGALDG
jgi:hypothetical protein